MIVRPLIETFGDSLKAVKIELSLEGGISMKLKVFRKNLLHELVLLVHSEASSVGLPGYNVGVSVVFNVIQYGMQFHGEMGLI
jgi:hypothetical protein